METRMNPTRRNRRRFTALLAALGAGAVAPLGTASAADWPTRPVKLIVPYSAGGPTDAIARLLAEHMSRSLGEAVVVENRAGAGGTIGVGAMLNAAPDGHTIALVAPGPLAGMPNLTRTTYSADDMDYLTLVARIPSVLVVNAGSGVDSVEGLVKLAKADPDKLNYSTAGPGTTPHIGMELLKDQAGIQLLHVPYKGAAPAVTALLSGEVQATMVDLLPVLPHVTSGRLKVLATAGATRAPQLPEVPTMAEKGLPGVAMETTYGIVGPKGIPAAVRDRIRESAMAAVASPEVKERLLNQGAIPATSTADEYRQLMRAESDKWRDIIAKAKISLN
jgi:tripartite-type tricarboxylate transporter receptor subunit TctC